MDQQTTGTVRRADRPEDFARFDVDPMCVAPAEDAARIGTEPGCFEWWYFDAMLQNGVSIVVVFYTKPATSPQLPLTPAVSINIRRPNSNDPPKDPKLFAPAEFKALPGRCDVSIGSNRIEGNLSNYSVEAAMDGVSVKMQLRSLTPPLRVGTGHLLFDREGSERYFGWLAPVPRGVVNVEYELDGEHVTQTGAGYHDHNWGNAPMVGMIHDWYWGRAQVGDYTIIAAHVTPQAVYGQATHTDFILIKNGQFIARGDANVTFAKDQVADDPETGKPVAGLVQYVFVDGGTRYVVTFVRDTKIFARQIGQAAYHRFIGRCTMEIIEGKAPTTLPPAPAMWEFMWLGNAPAAAAFDLYAACMAHPKN